jgi:site-specific recombinase XerD
MYKKDGVYWCKITIPGQKTVFRSLGKDRKQAKKKEADLRRQVEEGKLFDNKKSSGVTVRILLNRYESEVSMLRVQKGKKKLDTVKNEKYLINTLNRHLGDLFLPDVSHEDLEAYELTRYDEGVSEIAVHHELWLLKASFHWAINRRDLLRKSPFSKYDLPCGDKQRVRCMEEWEEKELNKALSKPKNRLLRQFVAIFHDTLIRPINLCKLELSQVNLKERFIHLGKTKNGEPNLVPLTDNCFRIIQEVLKDRQAQKVLKLKFANRVFLNEGRTINTNIMGRWFREVVYGKARFKTLEDGTKERTVEDGTNIKDLRLYDMKHDRMTRERRQGATLSDLAEIAGQEDLRSTRRYAHQSLETKRRIVKEFKPVFEQQNNATG